jgi:hypothetical protein
LRTFAVAVAVAVAVNDHVNDHVHDRWPNFGRRTLIWLDPSRPCQIVSSFVGSPLSSWSVLLRAVKTTGDVEIVATVDQTDMRGLVTA